MADPYFRDIANRDYTEEGNFCHSPFSSDSLANEDAFISCDGSLTFAGEAGIYEAVVELGTNTGMVELTFESLSIPDRFQIVWDSDIVADSLFVGDGLIDDEDPIVGTHDLTKYILNSDLEFDENGTEQVVIVESELASIDPLDLRDVGGHGNQVGVVANYPSASAVAYDGEVKLQFNKATSTPTKAIIRVIGVVEQTRWSLQNINCPS